ADLQVLEVFGTVDGLGAGGDFTEAVVPDFFHDDQVVLVDLAANVLAQLAVHRFPDGVVIGERESDAADGGRGHQGGKNQARQGKELDRARTQLVQGFG